MEKAVREVDQAMKNAGKQYDDATYKVAKEQSKADVAIDVTKQNEIHKCNNASKQVWEARGKAADAIVNARKDANKKCDDATKDLAGTGETDEHKSWIGEKFDG